MSLFQVASSEEIPFPSWNSSAKRNLKLSKLIDLLLPKLTFQPLVRDIAQEINNDARFQV